jgi:hypothetical protein
MLRTTRRNRDSTSRKTLKQRGGAIWREYSDIDTKTSRQSVEVVNSDWKNTIESAIEKKLLPESLNLLFVQTLTAGKSPVDELHALFDAHSYQDSLLILSRQLCVAKLLFGGDFVSKIFTELTLKDAADKFNIILKDDTNRLARFYAYDVFTFLNLARPREGLSTDRITYLFTSYRISHEEMFLEPTILKNMFVHGLTSLFISMKQNEDDIALIAPLRSSSGNTQYKNMIRFIGRFWRRYIDKDCNKYTGHGIGGSFYLEQEYKEDTPTPKGTFDEMVNIRDSTEDLTFYSKFVDVLCAKKTSGETTKLNSREYKDSKDRNTWIDFIVDLFLLYKTEPITRKSVMEFIVRDPAGTTGSAPRGFIPNELLKVAYPGTEVTPEKLLTKLAPEYISLLLHLITILKQNEKLYHDALPADKQSEFVAKFGPPIKEMNEA